MRGNGFGRLGRTNDPGFFQFFLPRLTRSRRRRFSRRRLRLHLLFLILKAGALQQKEFGVQPHPKNHVVIHGGSQFKMKRARVPTQQIFNDENDVLADLTLQRLMINGPHLHQKGPDRLHGSSALLNPQRIFKIIIRDNALLDQRVAKTASGIRRGINDLALIEDQPPRSFLADQREDAGAFAQADDLKDVA